MVVATADGLRLADHDLGGSGPPLLMAHAAGLHGLVLEPLARRLAGAFRCHSFDHRAHGDSRLPPDRELDWHGLATDVLAVVDGLDLDRPVAFGHSGGATALLMAEQARPGTFAALYLFEPVIVDADPPLGRDPDNWLAARARRRRSDFPSREAALAHFAAKPPLARLDPEALRAYVDHGFDDLPGGGVTLKCRPEHEAAVYETATDHDAFGRLGLVACPALVACGADTDGCPPALAGAHSRRLRRGRWEALPGLGHLGPLERPDDVAASVRRFLVPAATELR